MYFVSIKSVLPHPPAHFRERWKNKRSSLERYNRCFLNYVMKYNRIIIFLAEYYFSGEHNLNYIGLKLYLLQETKKTFVRGFSFFPAD